MTTNLILNEDFLQVGNKLAANSVDLIFADPPFNINFKYPGYRDNMNPSDYVLWCKEWLRICYNILKVNGSIYIAIGDEFVSEVSSLMKQRFFWRNNIIWNYSFGQSCKTKFSRCHTNILYYTKGTNFTWNAKDILVPSDRQTIYNDKRANANGMIPSDVWFIPRVAGTHKERVDYPCQMPESILERIIKVSSNEGDLVLDPFCGSGTTAAVAKKLNRQYWSTDISYDSYKVTQRRLDEPK